MRIFVTGASGWIGSALTRRLHEAGHQVVGLARSNASAELIAGLGADPVLGTLDDHDLLARTAAGVDGVVHLAFKHDIAFSGGFQDAVDADAAAVAAMTAELRGTDRPFVLASGLLGIAPGVVATEADGHRQDQDPATAGPPTGRTRLDTAEDLLALADAGVRAVVVRLPPTNHGEGDSGFVAGLVGTARRTGVAAYVGDGSSRWCAVHRDDSATLFQLAVEQAPAGSTLHAVGDTGVAQREIAEAIAARLALPTASIAAQDAPAQFGWLAGPLALDCAASHDLTSRLVGWQPSRPGLLADIGAGSYDHAGLA